VILVLRAFTVLESVGAILLAILRAVLASTPRGR
jgi:hypothetical protein